MTYFGVLSRSLPRGTGENDENHVRIIGVAAEIRARDFSNTGHKHYPYCLIQRARWGRQEKIA